MLGKLQNWQKLVEVGGWNNAKQKGLIRSEGKEYIVQEGDVLIIKHNAWPYSGSF